jgi:hypothetical protein
MKNPRLFKLFSTLLFIITTFSVVAQTWKTGGNSIGTGDFLGTTNGFSLIFKTNNTQQMSIDPKGNIQFTSFGIGKNGIISYDGKGNLIQLNYTGNNTDLLTGNGSFVSFSKLSPWQLNGTTLYYWGGNVGIGAGGFPTHTLEVNGTMQVNGDVIDSGTLFAKKITIPIIRTHRITGMPGDTAFALGDSSIHVATSGPFLNNIYGTPGLPPIPITGVALGYANNVYITPNCAAVGYQNTIYNPSGNGGIAIGYGNIINNVTGNGGIAIGYNLQNSIQSSIMMGNAGITSPGIFIGSNNRVGIGTTTPASTLEVNGTITSDGQPTPNTWTTSDWNVPLTYPTGSAIRTNSIGTYIGKYLGLGMIDDGITAGWFWITSQHADRSDNPNYPMALTLDATNNLYPTLNVNGTISATVNSNSPVWTTSSSSPYTPATNNANGGWTVPIVIPNGGAIRTSSAGNLGRYLGIGMVDGNTTGWYWIIQGNTSSSSPACYPMTLLMDANGNATITLSQNGWMDYIFAPDYKRMTIDEKEEYYTQNRHLPGVDPASVVETKGLNVNKNLLGILKNVEEDRLDITSLYKIIQQQQTEIEDLKTQLNSIRNTK